MRKTIAEFKSTSYRLVTVGLLILLLVVAPISLAQADSNEPVRETTTSDLSDIPNLERMDNETFKEHVGSVPSDRNPLLNTDNPKVQIKDKTPGSDKVITTDDLKEDPS